jgi:flagellar hook protein FlgE
MMRAMTAGVSGLRAHQTLMDVIGNNIANASTVGYRASRLTFREALSTELRRSASAGEGFPLANPMQIGNGARVGSIDALFSQGMITETGQPFDFAIGGRGLFVVRGEGGAAYSRAGNFQLAADGRLLLAGTDLALQGVNGDWSGASLNADELEEIRIPLDDVNPAQATSVVRLAGNLRADAAAGETRTVSIGVFDAAGASHTLELTFTAAGGGVWNWSARLDGGEASASQGTIVFDEAGRFTEFTYPDGASGLTLTTEGSSTLEIALEVEEGVTGTALATSLTAVEQDGHRAGELTEVIADVDGTLLGVYSNGVIETLGRIALADFGNPGGLSSAGGGLYAASESSGEPSILLPGDAGGPVLVSGALEGSNVDLAQELTNMIIAQRGFQANARVVMAADEMLSQASDLSY